MKLTFSQSRRRKEQLVVRVCEWLSMGCMVAAAGCVVVLLVHNLER